MTQDEYIQSASQRVREFLDRYKQMGGLDPETIYGVGDKNGFPLYLHWADLNALVCAVDTYLKKNA